MMKVGSLFSGVGGFDYGLEMAGMKVVWQAEIDTKCRSVLKRHWPNIHCYEDVKDVNKNTAEPVDLICGGFPCQDVSVAGQRAGLAGNRSSLWWEFHRVLAELSPQWCLIENVPGLLSSGKGRDMGTIIGSLADLGYSLSWRVLDAQYFGVPQRRRRVFIIGSLGDDWRSSAEVLDIAQGCRWDPPPSTKTGETVAALTRNGVGTCGPDDNQAQARHLVVDNIAACLNSGGNKGGFRTEPGEHLVTATNTGHGWWNETDIVSSLAERDWRSPRTLAFHATQDPISGDVTPACSAESSGALAVFVKARRAGENDPSPESWREGDVVPSLDAIGHTARTATAVISDQVRKLTPMECERLMGWPDDFTRWGHDGKEIANSNRYRMCGNGVVSNVSKWIGKRILAIVEEG